MSKVTVTLLRYADPDSYTGYAWNAYTAECLAVAAWKKMGKEIDRGKRNGGAFLERIIVVGPAQAAAAAMAAHLLPMGAVQKSMSDKVTVIRQKWDGERWYTEDQGEARCC